MVIVNLEKARHILLKPLEGHEGLDEAILVPGDGGVSVQAEAGVEGGVVALDVLRPGLHVQHSEASLSTMAILLLVVFRVIRGLHQGRERGEQGVIYLNR